MVTSSSHQTLLQRAGLDVGGVSILPAGAASALIGKSVVACARIRRRSPGRMAYQTAVQAVAEWVKSNRSVRGALGRKEAP